MGLRRGIETGWRRAAAAIVVIALAAVVAPAAGVASAQGDLPPVRGFNAVTQVDSEGRLVVAYTQLATDVSEQLLLLATCDDRDCTSQNIVELAAAAAGPVDLALDPNDRPVITFRRVPEQTVQILRCSNPGCAGARTVSDLGPGVGASVALNSLGRPVIAIATTEAEVRVVTCADDACRTSNSVDPSETVFPAGGCSFCLGPSLAIDSNDRPVIAYYVQGGAAAGPDVGLTLLRCSNADCSATNTRRVIEAGAFGNASLALAGDVPVISYADVNDGGLKFAACVDPACSRATTTLLEVSRPFGEGWPSEVRMSPDGLPVVLSADPQNTSLTLFMCDEPDCTVARPAVVTRAFGGGRASDSSRASFAIRPGGSPAIAFVGETPTGFALQALVCAASLCDSGDPVIVLDDGFATSLVAGDANCDGVLNILDAFATAQYVVALREGVTGCPLIDATNQISLANVMVEDELVTIQSAFRVSQCVVAVANALCPAG